MPNSPSEPAQSTTPPIATPPNLRTLPRLLLARTVQPRPTTDPRPKRLHRPNKTPRTVPREEKHHLLPMLHPLIRHQSRQLPLPLPLLPRPDPLLLLPLPPRPHLLPLAPHDRDSVGGVFLRAVLVEEDAVVDDGARFAFVLPEAVAVRDRVAVRVLFRAGRRGFERFVSVAGESGGRPDFGFCFGVGDEDG